MEKINKNNTQFKRKDRTKESKKMEVIKIKTNLKEREREFFKKKKPTAGLSEINAKKFF